MQPATEANVPIFEPVAPAILEPAAPAGAPRSNWFWAGWGVVAVSQLVAFWLLCDQQVRLADERRSEIQVQRVALAECLQSVHGSTFSSCRARLAARAPETIIVAQPAAAGAVPVSFNFGFR